MRKGRKRPPGLPAIAVGILLLAMALGLYRLLFFLIAVGLICFGIRAAQRM